MSFSLPEDDEDITGATARLGLLFPLIILAGLVYFLGPRLWSYLFDFTRQL